MTITPATDASTTTTGRSTDPGRSARTGRRQAGRLALTVAAAGVAVGLAAPALASASPHRAATVAYDFSSHRDHKDLTFNQLLSINDHRQIAGYYGSGATGHPNVGYVVSAPYGQGNYHVHDFPGGAQTQVTAINDSGTTGGFYADAAGDNFGFVDHAGTYTVVIDPHTSGSVNQVLGVNDHGLAAGFYTDGKGNAHGFLFNFHTDTYQPVTVGGATAVTVSGVNNSGDITGFETDAAGTTTAFVRLHTGRTLTFSGPGSTNTTAFGINDHDEVVGSYTVGKQSFGFTWSAGQLATVNDPDGIGSTVVNGLNNEGDLVGFYTDGGGNVDGFLATPR